MRHVLVTHRRQFTGSVFAGVSMRVRTVGEVEATDVFNGPGKGHYASVAEILSSEKNR